MKSSHAVIYVPGLGDTNISGRQKMLSTWHYRNVTIEALSMNWRTNEPWDTKLARLIQRIDELHATGVKLSLIGESAGACAVMQGLQQRADSLNAVILLCGKSQYPDRIGQHLRQRNPALFTAVSRSHDYIQTMPESHKAKVLNVHPVADPVVPVQETKIPGIQNARIPSFGHAISIVFGMTIWSFKIVQFIRKQGRK